MGESTTDLGCINEDAGVAGYKPKFVDVDDVTTRYYDIGSSEGAPILLVHGGNWSGLSSANIWSTAFDALSEESRVIAFDRIGCGMTDNPDSVDDYRYQSELEHALSVLDVLDIDSCHVVGSSRGAGLAARMVVEVPQQFETLHMINSATFGPRVGDETHRTERIFDVACKGIPPTDPEYTRRRYTQYAHQVANIDDEFCRTNAYMRRRGKAKRTADVLKSNGRQAIWERTMREHMDETHRRIKEGKLRVPTMYLFGRNDLTVPVEMALSAFDLLAQTNPAVRMKIVNNCGHLVYREYPQEFARTVLDFVEQWAGDP